MIAFHTTNAKRSSPTSGDALRKLRQGQNQYLYDQWDIRIAHCGDTNEHAWHGWVGGGHDLRCPGTPAAFAALLAERDAAREERDAMEQNVQEAALVLLQMQGQRDEWEERWRVNERLILAGDTPPMKAMREALRAAEAREAAAVERAEHAEAERSKAVMANRALETVAKVLGNEKAAAVERARTLLEALEQTREDIAAIHNAGWDSTRREAVALALGGIDLALAAVSPEPPPDDPTSGSTA